MTVSVREVAVAAGVSVGTVSNVFNHPDRVSPATRERVRAAVRELGFVRNEPARQLRAGTSRVLAYVVLDSGNPFFTDVALGIDDASAADEPLPLYLCNSANSAAREASHLDHLRQQRVMGIMVTPVDAESKLLEEVAQQGVPVVIVDRTRLDNRFCTVAVDDVLGGRLAVEHLVGLGHERIAFVGGPLHLGQVRDRLAGAHRAWVEAGLPGDDLSVVETDALGLHDGTDAFGRIRSLTERNHITAVFCANDLVAIGVLQEALASGHQVPTDMAIVGYDDIDFAAAAAVPLTSIRQPRREIGRAAARLVLDEGGNPNHEHEQVRFEPQLVVRRSTMN